MRKLLKIAVAVSVLSCNAFGANRRPQYPININTATRTELMQLPKVGAKTAERIIDFRKKNGGFRRVEELMQVKGIGEKTFDLLKPHLTLGKAWVNLSKSENNSLNKGD